MAAERTRQLEIQIAELQRLNQLKEDFLAAISHEMRTPLSNIKMAILVLESILEHQRMNKLDQPLNTQSVAVYMNILHDECERELKLVDDLLNMRFIDAKIYPLELTSINLQDWLLHITESFQRIVQTQRQILTVEVVPDLPNLVTDWDILTRVVSELLNNACKYTPSEEKIVIKVELTSSPTISTAEQESPESEKPYVRITISNCGVEIPTKEQQQIFEPFYRISQTQNQDNSLIFDFPQHIPPQQSLQDNGSGLGLALVKKLVEYLQGRIAVSSSQGWTIFTVELPLTL